MKLLDLNLLIYAVNTDADVHRAAKAWLEDVLSGEETVALPWVVILGFLRVVTGRRILPRPLSADHALRIVEGWIRLDHVILLHPGERHWSMLRTLLAATGTAGNLTTDAHLAALALEYDCELCTTDRDFARFDGLRWTNPIR